MKHIPCECIAPKKKVNATRGPRGGVRVRCAICQKDDDIILLGLKCKVCEKFGPSFGQPGDKTPSRCEKDKIHGDVNTAKFNHTILCECLEDKKVWATRGPRGGTPVRCSICQKNGDIILKGPKCKICEKFTPAFGKPEDKSPSRCDEDKLPGDINLKHHKCYCGRRALKCQPLNNHPVRCTKHEIPNDIYYGKPYCYCGQMANFGLLNETPFRCGTHRMPGHILYNAKLCYCGFTASYGKKKSSPERCSTHKLPSDKPSYATCSLCADTCVRKIGMICGGCKPKFETIHFEEYVMNQLFTLMGCKFIVQFSVPFEDCTEHMDTRTRQNLKLDGLLLGAPGIVTMFESDMIAHNDRPPELEDQRTQRCFYTMNAQYPNDPKVFLRWNPYPTFKRYKKIKSLPTERRHKILAESLVAFYHCINRTFIEKAEGSHVVFCGYSEEEIERCPYAASIQQTPKECDESLYVYKLPNSKTPLEHAKTLIEDLTKLIAPHKKTPRAKTSSSSKSKKQRKN